MKYKRLGEMLVDVGAISDNQLKEALAGQKETGERLGTYLVSHHYITEDQLVRILQMQLGIDFIDLNKVKIDPALVSLVPRNLAKQYRVVPVKLDKDSLYLAMEDPLNFMAIEAVKNASHKRIIPMIAYSSSMDRALSVFYENEGAAKAMEEMKEEQGVSATVEEAADVMNSDEINAAPTVKLVNSIIERGIVEKASDIHVEPREDEMVVRIRVDGRLNEILTIPKELQAAVISRFKVMGGMNIAERRIPQDGRAVVHRSSGDIDLRLSSLPTIYGEKIVIRLLTRDQNILNWKGIGITEEDHPKYERLLMNTSGVILIVGPTGSGKTSTLYTMINDLKNDSVNMISLEDPVEFQIDGITQVAINEKVGLTFASALRACLRQDPDIICVGEIRDGETAEIAMRAAMTGHLVLSTIHTEDAFSAIDRLKDMGVEPYLIGGAVRGIISQRLVRRICPDCREEYVPDPELIRYAGIRNPQQMHFYHGRGCHHCFESGYRGRIGVFEILPINAALRDVIASGITGTKLREMVMKQGFTPMIANGRKLVEEGVTTVDELVRTVVTLE